MFSFPEPSSSNGVEGSTGVTDLQWKDLSPIERSAVIAKGVIRDVVPWERAREYFYWRVRRRLAQDGLVAQLKAADGDLTHGACLNVVRGWVEEKDAAWEDDKAALAVFETDAEKIQAAIDGTKEKATAKLITQMLQSLSPEAKSSILGEVM